jgi:hypothetical protein
MQTALNENTSEVWPHIAPLLDDALAGLSAADRHAVVLRYFDGKSLGEVGAALGASEDAAKKRVTRAVEKLRRFFTKRGVTLTATVLTAAISANSVQAAPLGLAATVTAAAAKGTLISATITALVKGTMKTMTWVKLKFAIGASVAALLAGGVATVALSGNNDKSAQLKTSITTSDPKAVALFSKVTACYRSLTNYSDSGVAVTAGSLTNTFTTKLGRPNYYLVEWDQKSLPEFSFHGAVWSAGEGDLFFNAVPSRTPMFFHMRDSYSARIEAMGYSENASMFVPNLFAGRIPTGVLTLEGDGKIGSTDSQILVNTLEDREWKLWVGKEDFLVRKFEESYFTPPTGKTDISLDDATIRAALAKLGRPVTPESIANFRSEAEKVISTSAQKSSTTGSKSTEWHENILLNQPFNKTDFAYPIPAGLRPSDK